MYRKEVNERSPMRVFEKSMHGGLGRGNVGIVASVPGMGKTPLLVQIALDDLLRDRKVLHISHENPVDHVRTFYSEVFHDLSAMSKLDEPDAVMLEIERNRMIFSLLCDRDDVPLSQRGGRTSIGRIQEVVKFARDAAQFQPDVLIVDGFHLVRGSDEAVKALAALAKEIDAELWLSVTTEPVSGKTLPSPLDGIAALVQVAFCRLNHFEGSITSIQLNLGCFCSGNFNNALGSCGFRLPFLFSLRLTVVVSEI